MAVPKKRTSSTKRNMRRSHHAVHGIHLSVCPKCKSPVPSHTACGVCGTYQKREVIDVTKKLNRTEKKRKELAQQQG